MTNTIDSGTYRKFSTGAERDTARNKPLYVGLDPHWLAAVAMRCRMGDEKYKNSGGHKNWRRGIPLEVVLDSAMRHIENARMGATDGEEPDVYAQLAAASWNLMVAFATLQMIEHGLLPAELDDRTVYPPAAQGGEDDELDVTCLLEQVGVETTEDLLCAIDGLRAKIWSAVVMSDDDVPFNGRRPDYNDRPEMDWGRLQAGDYDYTE